MPKDDYSLFEKKYIASFDFITKNSADIQYKLLQVADQIIDRKKALGEIQKYIDYVNAYEIEKGIFEFALVNVMINRLPYDFVASIYNDKIYDICCNLDTNNKYVDNQTLLPNILNNTLNPYFVPFLSPEQIHPQRWMSLVLKKQIKDEALNNFQTTDMYQCSKCHSRKFKIMEIQLRCADESSSYVFTCMVCYHTFIK